MERNSVRSAARSPRPRQADDHAAGSSVGDDGQRRARLERIASRSAGGLTDTLREGVVTAALAVPYTTPEADRVRVSILYQYAAHLHRLHGDFNVDLHLGEDQLREYWKHLRCLVAASSANTALSVLRTVRDGHHFRAGDTMPRIPVTAPYTRAEFNVFRAAAHGLGGSTWADPAAVLLDLTGEAGLRGAEVNRARGTDLTYAAGRLSLHVTATTGHTRTVPLPAAAARRLVRHLGSPEFLLRPAYRHRPNTVNALVERLGHHSAAWRGFRAVRARHMWIAQLMTEPLAAGIVAHLAGLHGGSHTMTDLLEHLPALDDDAVAAAFAVTLSRPR